MLLAVSQRISAGTRSPASSRIISPGTSSLAGICSIAPPRRTLAWGADSSFSARRDRSARNSWIKPRIPFMIMIAIMVMASRYSPSMPEIRVAPIRTSTIKSLN
ncbi:hypothetical protein D3C71_1875970 [compost metagenome]